MKFIAKSLCCGCTACASICPKHAIQMKSDDEGFLYPDVDKDKCIECNLCESVCPIIYRDNLKEKFKPQKYLAVRLNNHDDLMVSSSGGAFWALTKEAIARNGVVVGAKYSDDVSVVHDFAETLEACEKFRGSKYSQSDIKQVFPKIKTLLQSGRTVLFSGNPCQVEGLNRYLQKNYENLITLDIVCHAVPSPKIFKEYCDYVSGSFHKKVVAINMRDKENHGWSHKFSYRYIFADGTYEIDSAKVSNWGRIFFSQYINRPSCHLCRFTNLQRPGDITVADFWDDAHNRDDIRSLNGTSLVLVNTKKGLEFFDCAKNSLKVYEISEKDSLQSCLLKPTPENPMRANFWAYYHRHGFLKTYKKYFAEFVIWKIVKKLIPLEIKTKVKNLIQEKRRR